MRFFSRKAPDPRIAGYLAGTKRSAAGKTRLASMPVIVLDAETTGFRVDRDRLLSIATVPVLAGRARVGGMRSWLIRQSGLRVNEATAVHGILPSESSRGVEEVAALEELAGELTGVLLVGHHIGFDAAVLDAAMKRHFGAGLRNPLIDTAVLSMQTVDAFKRTGYANQRPPGLDEVCAHLGLPVWERHTADGDAFATAQLFLLLCARLEARLGRDLVAGDLPVARGPG